MLAPTGYLISSFRFKKSHDKQKIALWRCYCIMLSFMNTFPSYRFRYSTNNANVILTFILTLFIFTFNIRSDE